MSNKYVHPLLAGLAMFAAVYLVEGALAGVGIHADKTFLDDTLLGIFAALAVFFLQRRRDTERELRRQQQYAAVIGQLNHHIRNALQVIVCRSELGNYSVPELQDVKNAVNRIDWALREILPRGAATHTPATADSGRIAPFPGEPPAPQTGPASIRRI